MRRMGWRMSCDVEVTERLENELCFTHVIAHSPTLPLLYLCHISFSNPSVALPTSQLILQPFRCFTYVIDTSPTSQLFHCFTHVTAHSPTLPLLYLCHSSFSNPSALPLLHLCHSSFSNPSIALPMSQLILQPLRCFTYVTVHSPTLLLLLLHRKLFT